MEIVKLLYANKLRLKRGSLFYTSLTVSVGYCIFLLVMNYIELVSHIGNSIVALNWYLLSSFSVAGTFCPIFCSEFIGTDYSDNTIRNKLIAGHTRRDIYLANFITVSAVHILLALISSTVTAVLGTLMFGWHIEHPAQFLLHYLSGILMLTALSALFTLMAMLIHRQTLSAVWSILTFLFLFSVESAVQRIIFARLDGQTEMVTTGILSQSVLEFVYDFIPLGQLMQVSHGLLLHPVRMPVLSLVFAVLMVLCGIMAFRKTDMK